MYTHKLPASQTYSSTTESLVNRRAQIVAVHRGLRSAQKYSNPTTPRTIMHGHGLDRPCDPKRVVATSSPTPSTSRALPPTQPDGVQAAPLLRDTTNPSCTI